MLDVATELWLDNGMTSSMKPSTERVHETRVQLSNYEKLLRVLQEMDCMDGEMLHVRRQIKNRKAWLKAWCE